MKTYLDNLRPFEKRLVVGVAFTLFIVFNVWFVVPHFSDWQQANFRIEKARNKLKTYNEEIAQSKKYKDFVDRIIAEVGAVPPEEQSLHFATEVQTKAAQSQVGLSYQSRITERTNLVFFLEKSQNVTTTTKEQQLVDFLVNLGSGNSLIRVRDLGLRPDAPRMLLTANIRLVANFQKKTPVKTPAAPGKGPAPAGKAGESLFN